MSAYRLPRGWRLALLSGLLLVSVLVLVLHLLFYSTTASRYLAHQLTASIEGLQLEAVSGNLWQGLSFDASYQQAGNRVDLNRVNLRILPRCLLRAELCIKTLTLEQLQISLPENPSENLSKSPSKREASLPTISMPLPLRIQSLQIQTLVVNRAEEVLLNLAALELDGTWRDDRLQLRQAGFIHPQCHTQLSGHIQLRGNYPLQAQLACTNQTSPLSQISASLSGNLQQLQLSVEAEYEVERESLTERWPLRGHLRLEPLASGPDPLPMSAELELRRPVMLADEQLQLESATLRLDGTFQNMAADLALQLASPHWPGGSDLQLNGHLSWHSAPQPTINIELQQLQGHLLQRPISGQGQLTWQPSQLLINTLELQLQDNRLSAQGTLASTAGITLAVDLPHVEHLWPSLQAALSGKLHIKGNLKQPDIQGQLQARSLRYGELQAEQAGLHIDLPQLGQAASELRVSLQKSQFDADALGDINLSAKGTLAQHQLAFGWQHGGKNNASLSCRGALVAETWQGECADFSFTRGEQQWSLSRPVALSYRPQHLSLAPLCLSHNRSRLCSRRPLTLADTGSGLWHLTGVDIDGSDLRWSWFQPWLPKGIDVQGGWGFTLAGEWRPGQPAFELGLSSAGAQLHWQQLPALQIAVTSLALDASLDASQLRVKGQGTTQAHGDFSGSATFDKTSIDADLAIANAQLASLLPLISSQVSSEGQATGISRLSGYLDTRLHLSGKRTQPYLQGTAVVRDGNLALSAMPLPLEAVNMTIEFDRHKAKGQGNFRVSGVPGDVRGQLALAPDGWHGELALVAEQIPLQLDDNVELTIAPDIALTLTPELVHLHGQVGIPHARVKLRQLPPQAVKPSADAVIVRSRAKDGLASGDRQRLRVTSDVKLLLGDDVIFQGFGLDTHLRGQLTLSQGSEQVTRANGRISLHQGRYRAYGQSLQIRHGDLIFIGDLDNPQLRIEAVRPLTDNQLVVGLRAEGPARNPSIRLFSIPEMPQQAKLHYLLTGQPPGVVSQQNSNHIATQALLSLGLDASGGLLDNTAKTLGVDQFRISAESGYAGPEVSLSGYLGSNLMVRYGIGVFDGVNALALRYHLARNLYLEAISGTANSLDLLWSIERAR